MGPFEGVSSAVAITTYNGDNSCQLEPEDRNKEAHLEEVSSAKKRKAFFLARAYASNKG